MRALFLSVLLFFLNGLYAAPIVNTINPSVSPSTGGAVVKIHGNHFKETSTVNFGNTPAASFVVNSDSLITATTPEHVPQVVSVTVAAPSGTSKLSRSSFFTFQGDWLAYAANFLSDSVSIINTQSHAVTNLPVGDLPSAEALTPDGKKIYVVNALSNDVSVIDCISNSVIATIPITNAKIIVMSPDGSRAYVSAINNVAVIDTELDSVIDNIPLNNISGQLLVTPDGTKLYVLAAPSILYIVNTTTNSAFAVDLGNGSPVSFAITADGTKLYITLADINSSVIAFETVTDTIVNNIPLGDTPLAIAITQDRSKVYVSSLDNMVTAIDIVSDSIVATIPVGTFPICLSITSDSSRLYVSNLNSNNITVVDTINDAVLSSIPVANNPFTNILLPDDSKVFVGIDVANNVTVISRPADVVTDTIPVQMDPQTIVITPDQAPLAKFRVKIGTVNKPTHFDASDSVSPTGTIASYFWDFGDGNSLTTVLPTTTHTYSHIGTFQVTLTVTNSAGTSTQKEYNLSNSQDNGTNSMNLKKNGGPTAKVSRTIQVFSRFIAPPRNFRGKQVENRFLTQTDLVNILTWSPSPDSRVIVYYLFRNGVRIASISAAAPLTYEDNQRIPDVSDHYRLTAVTSEGRQSHAVRLTLP